MSCRSRPKLGTQSCAPIPCRSAVSRRRRANRLVPVGEALRALCRRQQADRVRTAARRDVVGDLAEEIDDRLLAEAPHRRRELAGDGTAEALGAPVTAARPARRVVDSDMRRDDPGRLVPEDRVGAALEHPVGPLLAELAVGGAVEAGGRNAPAVVEHLALLGVERDPAALGLAAERPAESPRARQDAQARGMRERDDLGHRVPVVGEIVLRERVEDAGVAARGEVGHVPLHVPRDAYAEIGAAGARRRSGHDQFTPSPRLQSSRRRSGAGRAGRR